MTLNHFLRQYLIRLPVDREKGRQVGKTSVEGFFLLQLSNVGVTCMLVRLVCNEFWFSYPKMLHTSLRLIFSPWIIYAVLSCKIFPSDLSQNKGSIQPAGNVSRAFLNLNSSSAYSSVSIESAWQMPWHNTFARDYDLTDHFAADDLTSHGTVAECEMSLRKSKIVPGFLQQTEIADNPQALSNNNILIRIEQNLCRGLRKAGWNAVISASLQYQ